MTWLLISRAWTPRPCTALFPDTVLTPTKYTINKHICFPAQRGGGKLSWSLESHVTDQPLARFSHPPLSKQCPFTAAQWLSQPYNRIYKAGAPRLGTFLTFQGSLDRYTNPLQVSAYRLNLQYRKVKRSRLGWQRWKRWRGHSWVYIIRLTPPCICFVAKCHSLHWNIIGDCNDDAKFPL